MIYKVRAILDTQEDIIRTLLIDSNTDLESLHHALVDSFGFEPGQMASFYQSDSEWTQGTEIPLFDMSEEGKPFDMASVRIADQLNQETKQMLYVYDFFSMWTCFIEFVSMQESSERELPFLLVSVGDLPEEAPEKQFEATGKQSVDPFSDEALFGTSFDENPGNEGFENIDDLDLDQF